MGSTEENCVKVTIHWSSFTLKSLPTRRTNLCWRTKGKHGSTAVWKICPMLLTGEQRNEMKKPHRKKNSDDIIIVMSQQEVSFVLLLFIAHSPPFLSVYRRRLLRLWMFSGKFDTQRAMKSHLFAMERARRKETQKSDLLLCRLLAKQFNPKSQNEVFRASLRSVLRKESLLISFYDFLLCLNSFLTMFARRENRREWDGERGRKKETRRPTNENCKSLLVGEHQETTNCFGFSVLTLIQPITGVVSTSLDWSARNP